MSQFRKKGEGEKGGRKAGIGVGKRQTVVIPLGFSVLQAN